MKLLLYCTKAKPYLNCDYGLYDNESYFPEHFIYLADRKDQCSEVANGKIVAECDFEVDRLSNNNIYEDYLLEHNSELWENDILTKSCLTYNELNNYLSGNGYAIHIKNLHIFDRPRWLDEVYYKSVYSWGITYEIGYHEIHKAPQNMMYVYDKEGKEKNILISIRPEWLCKILNGEKTIEIRKKVLKEML